MPRDCRSARPVREHQGSGGRRPHTEVHPGGDFSHKCERPRHHASLARIKRPGGIPRGGAGRDGGGACSREGDRRRPAAHPHEHERRPGFRRGRWAESEDPGAGREGTHFRERHHPGGPWRCTSTWTKATPRVLSTSSSWSYTERSRTYPDSAPFHRKPKENRAFSLSTTPAVSRCRWKIIDKSCTLRGGAHSSFSNPM